MNKTANATEIKFSVPIVSVANPAVHTSPQQRVSIIANTNLADFSPQNSRAVTRAKDNTPATPNPSTTLFSSS